MCKAGYAGRDCLRLSDMMHSYICADQPSLLLAMMRRMKNMKMQMMKIMKKKMMKVLKKSNDR